MATTPDRNAFLTAVSAWLAERDVNFDADHLSGWIGYHWRHTQDSPEADRWAEEYAAELLPDGPGSRVERRSGRGAATMRGKVRCCDEQRAYAEIALPACGV
jgi:hypothetical protein